MPLRKLTPFFAYWRTIDALDREVVDAVVADGHATSAQLRDELSRWPGPHYWSRDGQGRRRVVLIRSIKSPPAERWWFHIFLFVATFVTVWMTGAQIIEPLRVARLNVADTWLANVWAWMQSSNAGLAFAVALMAVLLIHELGHYFVARRYLINASPPYFLPAPPAFGLLIGTFGAFIRLRGPIVDRRQLFDVGAAGPWAGLFVSVGLLVAGLQESQVMAGIHGATEQLIYVGNGRIPFFLGDSILLNVMKDWLVGEGTVVLHPLALAGWFGLFVTMLNLMPLGQLDGGHILYALMGRHQTKVGALVWIGLVFFGVTLFRGWLVWAFLILLLGRGRISHPSVLEPHRRVPGSRWPLGVATILLFVITFSPDPLPSVW